MANTAVIYTRLSAQREGDTQTLDTQAEVCARLAAHKELEVLETFAEGSGVSAFKKGQDRPELDRLQAYVRANPGTTVLAWEISRLTRRLVDLSSWVELMDTYGLRIVTPQLDTADPSGRLMLTIMAAMAEQESLEKSVRVTEGKVRQRSGNRYMGGTPPTGYRYVDDDSGALEIDPESAQVMQQAVKLFLDDRLSMRATALALNADGHLGRTGRPWTSGTIKNVFTTPAIAGLMEKADGTYGTIMGLEESGGIIDAARWREVMARIDKRSGRATGASKARRPPSRLLSAGIPTCGTCGGRMAAAWLASSRFRVPCPKARLSASSNLHACAVARITTSSPTHRKRWAATRATAVCGSTKYWCSSHTLFTSASMSLSDTLVVVKFCCSTPPRDGAAACTGDEFAVFSGDDGMDGGVRSAQARGKLLA